jgi:hypothetical protein
VEISGQVSADTTVKWKPVPGAASYRVSWRGTTDAQWRFSQRVTGATEVKLANTVIDDWFFGVSAVSADGYESPIVYPGVAGAFFRPAQ